MTPQRRKPPPPGNGFLGWLGRQIGYVKHAVKTDVNKPKQTKPADAAPAADRAQPKSEAPPQVVHREARVEEARLADQPNLTFRRTVIDEVIVDEAAEKSSPPPGPQT